jgi:hypothetical protein
MLSDEVKVTIIAALKEKRASLKAFASNYLITASRNKSGAIWQLYNPMQIEIDRIDAALAALDALGAANATHAYDVAELIEKQKYILELERAVMTDNVREAIVYLLGDEWTVHNPLWGIADHRDKYYLEIVHDWLRRQQPTAINPPEEEAT